MKSGTYPTSGVWPNFSDSGRNVPALSAKSAQAPQISIFQAATPLWAAVVFTIAAMTDFLDGWVAQLNLGSC